jgi:hypothetical protein
MSELKSEGQMSSSQLKVAHYDQKVQIDQQHKILDLMNQNLNNLAQAIVRAEQQERLAAEEAAKKAEEKSEAPKPVVEAVANA